MNIQAEGSSRGPEGTTRVIIELNTQTIEYIDSIRVRLRCRSRGYIIQHLLAELAAAESTKSQNRGARLKQWIKFWIRRKQI